MSLGVGIKRDETLKRRDLNSSYTLGSNSGLKHTVSLVVVTQEPGGSCCLLLFIVMKEPSRVYFESIIRELKI